MVIRCVEVFVDGKYYLVTCQVSFHQKVCNTHYGPRVWEEVEDFRITNVLSLDTSEYVSETPEIYAAVCKEVCND